MGRNTANTRGAVSYSADAHVLLPSRFQAIKIFERDPTPIALNANETAVVPEASF